MAKPLHIVRTKDAGQEAAWKWFWRRVLVDTKKPKKERTK